MENLLKVLKTRLTNFNLWLFKVFFPSDVLFVYKKIELNDMIMKMIYMLLLIIQSYNEICCTDYFHEKYFIDNDFMGCYCVIDGCTNDQL